MIWDESGWNEPIRAVYRRLAQARRAHPALSKGSFETLLALNGVYAYRREFAQDQAVVVLNPREARTQVKILLAAAGEVSHWSDILSGQVYRSCGKELVVDSLPAKTACLLVPEIRPGGVQ